MASAVTSIEVYATRRFRNRQTGAVTAFAIPMCGFAIQMGFAMRSVSLHNV